MKTERNPMNSPTPPQNRPNNAIEDHQSGFAAISAKTPVDEAFRTAFLQNKLLIAHTHPGLGITARDQAIAVLVDRLGREAAADMLARPRPGGVGEGIFYNQDFKTSWCLGTSFSCDYVCPLPPRRQRQHVALYNRNQPIRARGRGIRFLLWSGHAAFPRVRLGPDRLLAD